MCTCEGYIPWNAYSDTSAAGRLIAKGHKEWCMKFIVCDRCKRDGTAANKIFFSDTKKMAAFNDVLLVGVLKVHKRYCTRPDQIHLNALVTWRRDNGVRQWEYVRELYRELRESVGVQDLQELSELKDVFIRRAQMLKDVNLEAEIPNLLQALVFDSEGRLRIKWRIWENDVGTACILCKRVNT